jgi:hypothetical protein
MSRRLILMSSEAASIDAVLTVSLPTDVPLIAVCWSPPGAQAAAALASSTVIDLSAVGAPLGERLLGATGVTTLTRVLQRTAPGRLLASFSPAHQSRRFAARLWSTEAWTPAPGDVIVALDLPATRAAWLAQRATPGSAAVLGLSPGLKRIAEG